MYYIPLKYKCINKLLCFLKVISILVLLCKEIIKVHKLGVTKTVKAMRREMQNILFNTVCPNLATFVPQHSMLPCICSRGAAAGW